MIFDNPKGFFQTRLTIGNKQTLHQQIPYSLLNILADIGGVFEILVYILSFILLPISEHSFTIHSAKSLFHLKSIDDQYFETISKGDYSGFKRIQFKTKDNLRLFV